MVQVFTVHLSSDAARADAAFGTVDRGELSAADLTALLERFAALDPAQDRPADPHIAIAAPAGEFQVRTAHGKLFLHHSRAPAEPGAELAAAEIAAQLAPAPAAAARVPAAVRPTPAPRRALAPALLLASVALNAFTLYSVFHTEPVDASPAVVLVTDDAGAAQRRRELAGTYVTGARPGDRRIVVHEQGRIEFSELGAAGSTRADEASYRLAQHGAKFRLVTPASGVIEVLNLETLVYYRDTYRRR